MNPMNCIGASSVPTLGMLFPLGPEFNVDAATGNVGIGTMTPGRPLDVQGTARVTGFEMPTGANIGYVLKSDSAGRGAWQPDTSVPDGDWVVNGTSMYSGVSGAVGIGTSLPTAKLTVKTVDIPIVPALDVKAINASTPPLFPFSALRATIDASVAGTGGYAVEGIGPSNGSGTASGGVRGEGVVGIRGFSPAASGFGGRFEGNTGLRSEASAPDGLAGLFLGRGFFSGEVGLGATPPERRLHVQGLGFLGGAARFESTDHENAVEIVGSNAAGVFNTARLELHDLADPTNAAYIAITGSQGAPAGDLRVITGGITGPGAGERMRITKDGRVGIGTTNPLNPLSVVGNIDGANFFIQGGAAESAGTTGFGTSNGPAIQYWGNNTANAGRLIVATGGAVRMVIDVSGNVGIGTSTPVTDFHVDGLAQIGTGTPPPVGATGRLMVLGGSNDGPAILASSSSTNQFYGAIHGHSTTRPALFGESGGNGTGIYTIHGGGGFAAWFDGKAYVSGDVGIGTSTPAFKLEVNGSAGKPGGGSWSLSSDRRLKKDIEDIDGALDTLLALRGVTFEYRDPAGIRELAGKRVGFIAQEVEEVLPDWVEEAAGYKRLTVRGFEALAVEALRELADENAAARRQNAALKNRVADLEGLATANAALEKRVAELEGIGSRLDALEVAFAAPEGR
ncbi:MAG: tail fiber domain-containing protein [bacterium]|nr:tail fiber domain-containing protein [bacterium]